MDSENYNYPARQVYLLANFQFLGYKQVTTKYRVFLESSRVAKILDILIIPILMRCAGYIQSKNYVMNYC